MKLAHYYFDGYLFCSVMRAGVVAATAALSAAEHTLVRLQSHFLRNTVSNAGIRVVAGIW